MPLSLYGKRAGAMLGSAILWMTFSSPPLSDAAPTERQKPRLLVLTDISSLTAGVREPDDGQSLIRLMLYANDIDIEGMVASSNMVHGQVVRPELIREVVEAYAKVRPNLLQHDPGYPPAERLLAGVKAGQPVADTNVPVMESIGQGKDTEGSEWIIKTTDRPDRRPLWINIWGGSADLAQALWKVRETRKPTELRKFVAKLRIHAIGDQDSTGPWIRENFPDLFYIIRRFGYRGIYRGGDSSLVSPQWVETHIRNGHGALGALYPNYNGGDIWGRELGPVKGIKEGDTPAFLALLPNGLNNPDEPTWESWGGQLAPERSNPRHFTDIPYPAAQSSDPDPRIGWVYRWRPDFQADFQARLDWCVKPYKEANHPPIVHIAGSLRRKARSGQPLTLDARKSSDPDGDRLTFRWTALHDEFHLTNADTPQPRITLPKVTEPQEVQLLLTVRDDGVPPLASYARVVIRVEP